MNYRLMLLACVLLFAGCEKKPTELDLKSPCCQEIEYAGDDDLIGSIEVLARQSNANFDRNLLFMPTIFTPNRDLLNETFSVKLYPSVNADFKAELTNVKIYNKRKKVITEFGADGSWNGETKSGKIENGTFGYEITLTFPDKREVLVYGSFMLRTCLESDDDPSQFIFEDQLIPGSSATLTSNDAVSACN